MIRLHLIDRKEWDAVLERSADELVLYCPVADPPPVGIPVAVEVTFNRGPWVELRGIVCWRRPPSPTSRKLQPAVKVSLDREERPKITYLNAYAAGLLDDRRRGQRRYPLSVPVIYLDPRGRHLNTTLDVSEGGFSMRRSLPPEVGCEELFSVFLPCPLGTFRVRGRIARVTTHPLTSGIGVQILFSDIDQEAAFTAALREVTNRRLVAKSPGDGRRLAFPEFGKRALSSSDGGNGPGRRPGNEPSRSRRGRRA